MSCGTLAGSRAIGLRYRLREKQARISFGWQSRNQVLHSVLSRVTYVGVGVCDLSARSCLERFHSVHRVERFLATIGSDEIALSRGL
jgi:hypothetical protein